MALRRFPMSLRAKEEEENAFAFVSPSTRMELQLLIEQFHYLRDPIVAIELLTECSVRKKIEECEYHLGRLYVLRVPVRTPEDKARSCRWWTLHIPHTIDFRSTRESPPCSGFGGRVFASLLSLSSRNTNLICPE